MAVLGLVGCGNMARAMLKGILAKGLYKPEEIIVSRRSPGELQKIRDEFGVCVTEDNARVAEEADVLMLAVKPGVLGTVVPEIRDFVKKDTLVISVAAGRTIADLAALFGREVKLVRTMPNTPALVLAGATGMCFDKNITEEEKVEAVRIFESFGTVVLTEERLMDAVAGVSGSSPAYVFMLIEAMADAAVADGMPRTQAYGLAAQSVMGSAKMVLETGRHPGELKDMVCSPGGTTIEAVRVLEEKGFRSAVIEGQRACVRKAGQL